MQGSVKLVLLLDYDGTLAPIAPTPGEARMKASLRRKLKKLAASKNLILGIVSGRSLRDVRKQVGIQRIVYAGNHGLEIAGHGINFVEPKARRLRPVIRHIGKELSKLSHGIKGVWLEDKGLTLSVHFRKASRSSALLIERRTREFLRPFVSKKQVVISEGKKVLEVRPRTKWDKGRALEFILQYFSKMKPRQLLCPIYAGDDKTDEAAFKAVKRVGGVGILVSKRPKPTQAGFRISSPAEVEKYLAFF